MNMKFSRPGREPSEWSLKNDELLEAANTTREQNMDTCYELYLLTAVRVLQSEDERPDNIESCGGD